MSDQGERRRLVEEAMEADATKVRRRFMLGGAATLVVAAAAVVAYLQFGGSDLARAADRAEERTARVRFDLQGGPTYRGASVAGEVVTTGDNARFAGEGTFTVGREEPAPATIRKVGAH